MTAESLAKQLNGREYGDEITREECIQAKLANLLVVFGASDDLVECRGVFEDEMGAIGEQDLYFTRKGPLHPHDGDCDCHYCGYEAAKGLAKSIHAAFTNGWKFSATLPHAKFTIKEHGEIYGEGLVVQL